MNIKHKKDYQTCLLSSICSYVSAFYNPKLLLAIVKNIILDQNMETSFLNKGEKRLSRCMIDQTKANFEIQPSLATLIAPLQLYNDVQIERQNKAINQLSEIRHIIKKSFNININIDRYKKKKLRTQNNQQHGQFTYLHQINLTERNPSRQFNSSQEPGRVPLCLKLNMNPKRKSQTKIKNEQLKKSHNIGEVRLQFISKLYLVSMIYEHRFNEYARVMQSLTKIYPQAMNKNKDILQKLSMYIIYIIESIRNQINQAIQVSYPVQQIQQGYNQNQGQGCSSGRDQVNFKRSPKQNLFNLKERKMKHLANIKQVNLKYTQLSKQISEIAKRENKNKEEKTTIWKKKGNQPKNLFKTEPTNETSKIKQNKKYVSKGCLSIKSSMTNNPTCRSIMRSNNQQQKNMKRPSIELITSAIEDERIRKLKQMAKKGEKYSRFRHRQALNIEMDSSNTVRKEKQIKNNTKKVKKQVMISQSNKNSRVSEITSKVEGQKNKKKISKIMRKSKIGIFQQYCNKLENDFDGPPEITEHNSNNYFSLDIINISGSTSMHSIKSNFSKVTSKSKQGKCKSKNFRKYTFCYRKSGRKYTNLANVNLRGKSVKSIELNLQINESFRQIIQSAMKNKLLQLNRKCKKFNQRFGQILHKNSKESTASQAVKQTDVIREDDTTFIMKKSKILKDKFFLGRSKYRKLNTSGSSMSMSKERLSSSVNGNQSQSFSKNEMNRRVGITYRQSQKWKKDMKVKNKQKQSKIVRVLQNKNSVEAKQKQQGTDSVRNWSRKKVSQKKLQFKRRDLSDQKLMYQQSLKVEDKFVVKLEDRQNLVKNYINFYPNIECTLDRICRQNQKYDFETNHEAEQNKIIELVPLSTLKFQVKKQIQRDLEIDQRENNMQKKAFNEHNQAIKLTKRLISAVNKLHQRQLSQNI